MRTAAILLFVLPLIAQDSRFGVHSRLVLVPVTVTDANGRSVDDLEAADFLLLDGGRERKVAVDTIATGVAPIALVIAVQSSGISIPVLEKVRRIGAMIQPLSRENAAVQPWFPSLRAWNGCRTARTTPIGSNMRSINSNRANTSGRSCSTQWMLPLRVSAANRIRGECCCSFPNRATEAARRPWRPSRLPPSPPT